MPNIIDRILSEVCLDERISDGVFDMSNNLHMDVLRENLTDSLGMKLNDVKDIHNNMLEGKYPERQAYNKDGLLVTFPTPQHKAKAIQRGTHFEQDPTKGAQNVFGGGQQPATPGAQPASEPAGGAQPAGGAPEAPQQNVFPQGQPAITPPTSGTDASALPASETPPKEPSAPSVQASSSSLPASSLPAPPESPAAQGQLAVEPQAPPQSPQSAPPQAPPPNFETPKSSEQRAAEAQVVKQMMRGDNNNQTIQPILTERRLIELNRVFNFAMQMGYQEAMKVLSEAMNK